MDNFSCGICYEIFDTENCLPKSLSCGHTLCSKCLANVLAPQSQSLCPFCKETLEKDGSYPTNFALLNLKDDHLNLKDELKTFTSFKERFTEEFSKFEEERAVVAEKQKSVDSFVEVCDNLISTFNDVSDHISSKLHLNIAIEKTIEVNKKFESLKVPNEVNQILESLPIPSKSWHKLRDCRNSKDFMLQLQDKAKVGLVFAVELSLVLKRNIFGKLTFHGTNCYVHSLGPEEIDQRCSATFVPFQDLRQCLMGKSFEAFLKISNIGGSTVRPEIQLGKDPLVSDFVKLCTGELGPSYKGVRCCKCDVFSVKGYMSNGILTARPISLTTSDSIVLTPVNANDYCVQGGMDKSFNIWKPTTSFSYPNIIGIFQNVPNFERLISFEPEAPKIIDCGVLFDFAQF